MRSMKEPASNEHLVKILIPIASFVDKEKLLSGLNALTLFRSPLIMLFHVIALPSRTSPLDISAHKEAVSAAENRLKDIAEWLKEQGCQVMVKVVLARNIVEGIVTEANSGNYSVVLMMKRKMRKGLGALLQKSISERVIRSVNCLVLTTLVDYR